GSPASRRSSVQEVMSSLGVLRVVEQNRQLDTAMPDLREVSCGRVPWIQIGSCVIWWEQYQRAQEVQQVTSISLVSVLLVLAEEVGECVSRRLGLATVAQDHLDQIVAPAVMT